MNRMLLALVSVFVMAGCASEPEPASFDSALYDGRPVDTLTSELAPLTEQEAITRGDLALSSGNTDLALYEYIRSVEFPDAKYQDKSLYTIGRIHYSRGNLPLSEKAYLMALDYNPNNIKVLEHLGAMYSKQGDVEQGKSYFFRALNADQVRLNNAKMLDGDVVTVASIKSLQVDNESPALAYMGLGVLYDVEAKHDIAKALLHKALKIKTNSVKTLVNLGYSYYMSGEYPDAQRYTLAALEKDPTNEKAQNNLALIYLGKDEVKRAINVFMRHMSAPEALNNVGYFLILQGKPDKAIPYLQQAIDKKPSYYKVANENLERALAEVRAKESQQAEQKEEVVQ